MLVDKSAGSQLRDVNVALIAITPFETPRTCKGYLTNEPQLNYKLLQRLVPHKNVTIWYMATCGKLFLTKVVHH